MPSYTTNSRYTILRLRYHNWGADIGSQDTEGGALAEAHNQCSDQVPTVYFQHLHLLKFISTLHAQGSNLMDG